MKIRNKRAIRHKRTSEIGITKHKKMEGLLRHADVLRRTFDSARDAMFVLDAKVPPVIVECNRAASYIFGYKKFEMVGKTTAFLHVSDESLRKFQAQLYPAIEKDEYFTLEYQMKRKDGFAFPSDHTVTQVIGDDGKRIGWVSVVRDITERKRMEEELRRSRQFLESIIENANVWLNVLDNEQNVLIWNKAAEIMSGYSREEVVGHGKIWEWLYPDEEYRKQITDSVADILRHGRVEQDVETRIQRKDGETRIISWNERNMVDEHGKVIGSIAIGRDVTERKRMQEELERYSKGLEELVAERSGKLAESEKRFRELADLLPQIVFETGDKAKLLFLNRVGFALTGYSEEDLRKGLNAFQMFVPEDRNRIMENMRRILSGEKTGGNEYTALRKDGSTFPVIIHSSPISEDKPVGLRGIAIDITERKRLEERLLKAERLAAIGETAAMIGHDLRNPLQGIIGATYVLKKESLPVEDRNEMIELIERSVESADKIVHDLLEYSREIHLELVEATPKSIVRDALLMIKIPESIKILDFSEEQPAIRVDAEKVKRAFANIVRNAVEAMPNGGTITISCRESDGNLEVSFSDTGKGVPQEAIDKTWMPFYTTKAKGIGLGLPICRRIVEAHGGSMSLRSTFGEGATVITTIPIKPTRSEVNKT